MTCKLCDCWRLALEGTQPRLRGDRTPRVLTNGGVCSGGVLAKVAVTAGIRQTLATGAGFQDSRMDANHLLLWVVGANSVLMLLRSFSVRRVTGWSVLSGTLLLVLAACYFWKPELAGYVVGAPWTLLVLVPALGSRLLTWLLLRHHYRWSWLLAQLMAWLHPADGYWGQPRFIQAMECLYRGDTERARLLLATMKERNSTMIILSRLLVARMEDRWEELRVWIRAHVLDQQTGDTVLIDAYIQSLGETSRHDELLEAYETLVVNNKRLVDSFQTNLIRLHTAAYCGEVDLVIRLLRGPLSSLPTETKDFWHATSLQTAGQHAKATALFTRLALGADQQVAQRSRVRLDRALPIPADVLSATKLFGTMAETLGHETTYAVLGTSTQRPAPVTWLLVLGLLVVFCLEIPGGTQSEENMAQLGALIVPFSRTPGEYHRYLFAAFLHFGALHLLMNVFGLQWFGQRLERAWGSLPMLACYLFTAIGSLTLFQWILESWLGYDMSSATIVVVGASGGVMGLIGGLLGHLLVGSLLGKSLQVSRELGMLAFVVALQTFFDINSPEVSATVHLTGVALGFLFGVVFAFLTRGRSRRAARNTSQTQLQPVPAA